MEIHIYNPAVVAGIAMVLIVTVFAGLHQATNGHIWKNFFRVVSGSRRWRWGIVLAGAIPVGLSVLSGILTGDTSIVMMAAKTLVMTLGVLPVVIFIYVLQKNRYEKAQVQQYFCEIDRLRGDDSLFAARRIRTCILELNRKGITAINLSHCSLKTRDLRTIRLYHADLRNADLSGADLTGASFTGTKLQEANLKGAKLSDTFFFTSNLQHADLSYADLKDADLRETDLRGARLDHAALAGARLDNAKLKDASLCCANLKNSTVTIKQLMSARTLYQASLDPKIHSGVLARQDRLIDEPNPGIWMNGIAQLF